MVIVPFPSYCKSSVGCVHVPFSSKPGSIKVIALKGAAAEEGGVRVAMLIFLMSCAGYCNPCGPSATSLKMIEINVVVVSDFDCL